MGFDKLINKNATVDDTLRLIVTTINQCKDNSFVKAVVQKLGPVEPKEAFIKRLFDFYCRNVKYVLDNFGIEKVYTPALTMVQGKGDCKKAATFISSVLKCAGIEPVLKHVYYNGSDVYTHIFVIVPHSSYRNTSEFSINPYITLDPTNNCRYDTEVRYKSAKLYFLNGTNMELRQMGNSNFKDIPFTENISGSCGDMLGELDDIGTVVPMLPQKMNVKPFHAPLPFMNANASKLVRDHNVHPHTAILADIFELHPTTGQCINGPEYIGGWLGDAWNKVKAGVKNVVKKAADLGTHVFDKFKTVSLAIPRGAALGLIALNAHGLATHLLSAWTANPAKVDDFWKSIGGDPSKLKEALVSGAKKQSILGPDDMVVFDQQRVGVVLASLIAAGAPVVLMISKLIHEIKPNTDADKAASGAASSAVAAAADPNFNPNAAEFVQHMDQTGNPMEAPHAPGKLAVGSAFGSIGGFIFKSILLINLYFTNPQTASILGSIAISAPFIYFGIKKLKLWT